MANTITLAQFEQIDGLLNECLRRPRLEDIAPADLRKAYFLPEWKLLDALIDAFGVAASDEHPSTIDWACEVVTSALLSSSLVEAA